MRDERHVEERLPLLVDGSLAEEERTAVRAHLDGCAGCRTALAELEQVARALDGDAPAEPLGPMWPAVHARLGARFLPRFDAPFAAAATAALVAGFLIGMLAFDGSRLPPASNGADTAGVAEDWLTSIEPTLYDMYVAGADSAQEVSP